MDDSDTPEETSDRTAEESTTKHEDTDRTAISRRTTLASVLGIGGLGLLSGSGAATPPGPKWNKDVDADGNTLFDLGALEMINNPRFGTTDNTALRGIVNSERFLLVEPTATSHAPNIIGGHLSNGITSSNTLGATISGGGENGSANSVALRYPTIGGGTDNTADSSYATVSGGKSNEAGGSRATVGGGAGNEATENATVAGGTGNDAGGLDSTVGGGAGNEATSDHATVAGGLQNDATTRNATIAGGARNEASGLESTVGGGNGNRAKARGATVSGGGKRNAALPLPRNAVYGKFGTIGGGDDNQISDSSTNPDFARFATVSGGQSNEANRQYATVSGGRSNEADGEFATVGGGTGHSATDNATVAGGAQNDALGLDSTVAGGADNEATGSQSTIAGGDANRASDKGGTVPGGRGNEARGRYSFAAGLRATAEHDNTFVWSSPSTQTAPGISSTGPEQFIVDADGGVGIGTNAPATQLDVDGAVSIGDLGASAEQTSDIAVADSPTDVVYDSVVVDDRSEYDPATGVFTCANAGDYHVQAQVFWDGTLSEGEDIFLKIRVDGTVVMNASTVWPTSTTSGQRITQDVSKTLRNVSSGAEITITAQHGGSGTTTHDIVGLGKRANLQISQIG